MNIHHTEPGPSAYLKGPHDPDYTKTFTVTGYGMVGTGRTPQAAKRDLMEKIRQAGEA